MRRHAAVSKRARIFDVRANLRRRAILDDALRDIQIRPDAPPFAIHRVALDALLAEERKALHGGRVRGELAGRRVREELLEARELDGRELPRARVRLEALLLGLRPH